MREPQVRRWTRQEYHRLAESGVLDPDERVELLDGEIVQVTAQNRPHALAILKCEETLRHAFGKGFHLQYQLPLSLDLHSEPEPDVSVIRGSCVDYPDDHPPSAVLVIEVADSTLRKDRVFKASLYARAGIQEYWIVNLVERRLEVHRRPVADAAARCGWRYESVEYFSAGETVSPLHAPEASIAVEALLP